MLIGFGRTYAGYSGCKGQLIGAGSQGPGAEISIAQCQLITDIHISQLVFDRLEGRNGPAESMSLSGKINSALEAGFSATYLLKSKQNRRSIEHSAEHCPGTVARPVQELRLGAFKDKDALFPSGVDGIQRSTLYAILGEIDQTQTGLTVLIHCQYHRGIGNHRIRHRPFLSV